jgi:hypothetical protein
MVTLGDDDSHGESVTWQFAYFFSDAVLVKIQVVITDVLAASE